MHYAVPRMLHDSGQLERFYTDICAVGGVHLLNLLPAFIRPMGVKRLLNRSPQGVPRNLITSFTQFGWEYARRLAKAKDPSESTAVFLWAGKKFCELVLQQGFGNATATYTFNTAGLELLQAARRNGLFAVMEQTIAPCAVERRLMKEEHEAFPDWQNILPDDDHANEIAKREREEWGNSDIILCGSEFVKDGIAASGGPAERCRVIPYGVDVNVERIDRELRGGPLKVLTVGEVGLRKGAPYILNAARELKGKADFRMVGSINVLPQAESKLREYIELVGPIPRSEMLRQFMWADVFVLPSICEGSATVVYEALAYGLPVICTENTGSVIRNGLEGFIVPVRDGFAVAEKLAFIAADPDSYATISQNARKRADEYTLKSYAHRLSQIFGAGESPNPRSSVFL